MSPTDTQLGVQTLERYGWTVIQAPNANGQTGYVAGTPESRAEDLHWAFGNPDVDVVLEIRGGFGSAHVIPHLDFELVAANPKPFVGMSDITVLHLAIERFTGLKTFWGPMLVQLGVANEYTRNRFFEAVRGDPIRPIEGGPSDPAPTPIVGGTAEGLLTGGTVSLLVSSIGTQYEVDPEDRLLLLEEVNENAYEIDRMFTHLLHAGVLDAASGFIVCVSEKPRGSEFSGPSVALRHLLARVFEPLGKPTLYGLPLGHGNNLATIKLGAAARLESSDHRLIMI